MLKYAMALTALGIILAGCDTQAQGESEQERIMERARSQLPTPQTNNFLTRQAVVKWMQRQDVPDRPHYVYVYSDFGQVIGYYIAQSRPVCTNTFLTPPARTVGSGSRAVVQSPALDGVYYGNGCDQWFFFDAETDAMIELTGFKVFTSDQPLRIDAEPIRVQAE